MGNTLLNLMSALFDTTCVYFFSRHDRHFSHFAGIFAFRS
jgi:hypothetical protein